MIYLPSDKVETLTIRVVPHGMIPDAIREQMANNMSDPVCWPEPTGRGCFIPYEVGTATLEGMTDIMKIIEPWLLSIGIKDGESILFQWDW